VSICAIQNMEYFNRLPGFSQSPSGIEWTLLKKIPRIFILSCLIPCAIMLKLYLINDALNSEQLKIIYQCLGVLFSIWFFLTTAAIGCIVVIIMKGPAYVADPYELPKEDESLEEYKKLSDRFF
jgi:hypothetical protein